MAKKHIQRALSMALALVLCLALLPLAAFAADSVGGSVLTPPTQTEVKQPSIEDVKTDLDKDKVADGNVQDAIDKANEAAEEGPAAIEEADEKITGIENATDTKIEEIQDAADEKLEQPTEDYAAAEKKANEAVNTAEEKQAEVAKAQEQVDEENPTVEQYKAVADAAMEAANARTEAAEAIQAQVDSAQAVADAAASAYEAAQKEYAELLEKVNGDLDAVGDKEALLAAARVKLVEAEGKLTEANGTLDGLKINLNTAWRDVEDARSTLTGAIATYLAAQETVKGIKADIKAITDVYGSQLGGITQAELLEKVNAVRNANTLKNSADTAANDAGTVKSTFKTLNEIQTAVNGYTTDKTAIGTIASGIQAAEDTVNNVARPAANEALEGRQLGGLYVGVNHWFEKVYIDGGVEIDGITVGNKDGDITRDDLSKWLIEEPQPNDAGYVARHKWLETDQGKAIVERFLIDLREGKDTTFDKYLKNVADTITKLQNAENTLKEETAKLNHYKSKYEKDGKTFATAQELQNELNRLTIVEYGKVEANNAAEFDVKFNDKLAAAQLQLSGLITTYNGLVEKEKQLPADATAAQLKQALDTLASSATTGLSGALAALNGFVGNSGKYTLETAGLDGEMNTLLAKWGEVDGKKTDIVNADVAGKLQTMQNAGATANLMQQNYDAKHTETQKAHSDYLAAQALVEKVKGELDALQGPKDPKDFDALTQSKLEALKAELDDAQQQLQDAKDRHEEAKQAEEAAKQAAEDAQKVYDDAVEEARRTLEEAIGGTTGGTTIDDVAVPLASGPVTCAQFVDYLWRHEGSPEAEGGLFADHEYAPAIAWALSAGLIDEAFQPDELVTVADVRAILGSFAQVFGTNAVAAADLATLAGDEDEAVLNCDEVLAEFFGEEYTPAEVEDEAA